MESGSTNESSCLIWFTNKSWIRWILATAIKAIRAANECEKLGSAEINVQ